MLWEIVAMEIPFKFFNEVMIREMVVNFGNRPDIESSWPKEIQTLIKSCWSDAYRRRPDFEHVIHVLDSEIADLPIQ